MQVQVFIGLKNGVLDTQGNTVADALRDQGYQEVNDVKMGKWITLEIDTASEEEARAKAEAMCESLLVNQVIETYHLKLSDAKSTGSKAA